MMDTLLVRIAVETSPTKGLSKPSQMMIYMLLTVQIKAVVAIVGYLEAQVLIVLDLALLS